MENEQLILNRLMEIQEDIGTLKGKQDIFQKQIGMLSTAVLSLKTVCADRSFIQMDKKQAIYTIGLITTVFTGIGITV